MFTDDDLADHHDQPPAIQPDPGFDAQAFEAHEFHDDGGGAHGAHDGPAHDQATGYDDQSAAGGPSADLVMSGPSGQIDLGQPNLSYEGAPAVAVPAAGGGTDVYLDTDHDGGVDEAIHVGADGHFSVWSADQTGQWHVAATGTVDQHGTAVVDRTITSPVTSPAAFETAPTGEYPGVPEGDLAVASGSGYVDAGPPTYDMNHDGTADTAVVQSGDRVIQVSDTNGDGRADEMLQIDRDTHQAAVLTDDGSGHWTVVATGHIDAGGDFVHGAPSAGGSQVTTVDHPAGGEPDIVYRAADGSSTDLGRPTQDLNGDGVNESVTVRTDDGNLLILSDTDHDGRPDQIIRVDSDTGRAIWAVPDGKGGWAVVQTGHVDTDGSLVVDGTQGHASATDENVTVSVDGRSFDAGPATIDSDGDGAPDTVEVPGPAGSHIFYQDSDGDGVADRAWTTDADGTVTADYQLSPDGTWVEGGGGHR